MHTKEVKGILSAKNGMNVYRGCTHGCIYCDSRSVVYGMDHPFEDVEAKINAPELLEKALLSKRKRCMIGTGAMSDPYNHHEEELCITRKCLEIIDKYGFGATVLTKSSRILRDLDLLKSINRKSKCVVQITLTTYDERICKIIEPNVSSTKERFEALMKLKEEGIPTVVWLTPLLPFINDTEENLKGILDYCIKANVKGIICFGMGVTLREGDREYFYKKLDEHFPGLKEKYQRIYGDSYNCPSLNERKLMKIFIGICKEHNIIYDPDKCFEYLNEFPVIEEQTSLF